MSDQARLLDSLRQRQNRDGGWGYNQGMSWTEPTALASLALHSHGDGGSTYQHALAWIRKRQQKDGGWATNDAVATSSSVTSLCLLALGRSDGGSKAYSAGLNWTLGQVKPDLTAIQVILNRIQGMPAAESISGGCSWFPGTAAWVAPTVTMALAFMQASRIGFTDKRLLAETHRTRRYLLSRRCPDGGWNHGGTQFRSPDPESYPEITGMALLAFEQNDKPELTKSLELAMKMAHSPGSSEAQSWLRMGLARHGLVCQATTDRLARTTRDLALQILAKADQTNPLYV
jgi:hypothetical protein